MASKFGKIKNQALKKQWLADLRSGNLNQCQGTLCETGAKNIKASYCCLGVLGRSIKKTGAFPIKFVNGEITYNDDEQDCTLPNELRDEIGISEAGESRLINMNDKEEKSFKEIANFIEKHL